MRSAAGLGTWDEKCGDKIPYLSLNRGIIRPERLSLSMRRLCLSLLFAAILAPAALAAPRAVGDGTLAGRNVAGSVTIGASGVIWGRIGTGSIQVTNADGFAVKVSGWEKRVPATKAPWSTTYSGTDMRFQISGRYQVVIVGTKISFSAVGVGVARLTGDQGTGTSTGTGTVSSGGAAGNGPGSASAGKYAVGDGDWQAVPALPVSVSFPQPQPQPQQPSSP